MLAAAITLLISVLVALGVFVVAWIGMNQSPAMVPVKEPIWNQKSAAYTYAVKYYDDAV